VCINLYREAFELHFAGGKLLDVTGVGFREHGEIRIPPNLFAPLLLGYRDRHQLRDSHPDFGVWGQAGLLMDVLFPRMNSFLYTNY
jgi:hypothetical protein